MAKIPVDETEPKKDITLGEIAEILRDLHAQGVTLGSIRYVIDRVWWKEIDQEQEDIAEAQRLAAEAQARLAARGLTS